MAFLIANFAPIGGQSTRGKAPQVYSYQTTDSAATVDSSGYFDSVSSKLEVNDIILAACSTGGSVENGTFIVSSNSGGVVDVNNMSSSSTPGTVYLTAKIDDISTAGQIYVVSPVAGTVSKIYSALNGAISGADSVLTAKIGGTGITNGTMTVAYSGSAAGDVDSCTPTAANTVTAGGAIEIETDGGSTGTVATTITIVITVTGDTD